MRAAARRLVDAVLLRRSPSLPASHHHSSTRSLRHAATTPRSSPTLPAASLLPCWSAIQSRGAKVLGSDVRLGNIIQRKGRIYQVLKAQHTQHGRGGATIQVELRDVDSGNKVTERFRTDEAIERVFVEEKSFTFLYQEGNSIMIMEPSTFEQLEVPKELFGKGAAYLKDNMTVTLQLYDGKPMSASVPQRVTCKVVEAQPIAKGQTASPQFIWLLGFGSGSLTTLLQSTKCTKGLHWIMDLPCLLLHSSKLAIKLLSTLWMIHI